MRKIIIACILFLTSSVGFGLQNQTIIVLPMDEESTKLGLQIETKLMNSGKVNIKHYFDTLPNDFDPMLFMFNQKLSGLIIVSNNTLQIFSAKGFETNIVMDKDNFESSVSLILSIFPQKEPEKIIKDITEIDYISPLEDRKTTHSFSLYLGYGKGSIYLLTIQTNGGGYTYTQEFSLGDNIPLFMLAYNLGSRYFYFSVGLNTTLNFANPLFGLNLTGGLWMFKGFLSFGVDVLIENFIYNPQFFTKYDSMNNKYIPLTSEYPNSRIPRFSLLTLYVSPIMKLRLTRNDIITFIPIFIFSSEVAGDNVVFSDVNTGGRGAPTFLGLGLSIEMGITDNVSIESVIKVLLDSINREGYIKTSDINLMFLREFFGFTLVGVKYKF